MNRIKVVLVDSGVNMYHPYIEKNVSQAWKLDRKQKRLIADKKQVDQTGHGTACASVIKKEYPNVDIISVKVFDDKSECNILDLEYALSSLLDSYADFINLSLTVGDKTDLSMLKFICQELVKQDKNLIVSLANHKRRSYPACFKECIGVRGSILEDVDALWFNPQKPIQCVVDSTPFLHCNLNNEYSMFGKCNSYAAAKLTGILAYEKSIDNKRTIEDILKNKAINNKWNEWSLKKSKRFPDANKYRKDVEAQIVREIEKILKEFFLLDRNIDLKGKILLSSEVGLQYFQCYELIKKLEEYFSFKVNDYTYISREDFYTVYSLAYFVEQHTRKE